MKEKVLKVFNKYNGRKLDPIEIISEIKPNYTTSDIKNLLEILYDLVSEGVIVGTKKNTFKMVTDEYLKAKIEKVSSGNGYALMEETEDIFIDKKNMLDAGNGDICLIETFRNKGKLEGKVKRVLERNLPICEVKEENNVFYLVPRGDYNRNIILEENKDINLVDGLLVKVRSYKEDRDNIFVKVKEVIAHKNAPDIDTLLVMAELGVPHGFSKETLEEVKKLPMEVLEKDYAGRKDLTSEEIFTIDGKDTKDIDDAIGLKILDNGNYLLNVSIADVSNYVKYGSSTFKDAYNKGNSTYMADRVEPMLPVELSNGICSLNENVPRCALTCLMEIDQDGNIVNKELFKSIIKSKKKMNYDDVNEIIDGKYVSGYEEFKDTLLKMYKLSLILKKKMIERGSIEFISDEIKLIVDENGKLMDIKKCVDGKAENVIETFMIASNESSIDLLTKETDYAIYRVHATPSAKKLEEYIHFVNSLGYTIKGKINYNHINNKDIQRILEVINKTKDKELLNQRLLRSMQKAVYSENNIGHFGLGSKKYTHETSPIRRFSDLLLHYLIKVALFDENIGASLTEIGRALPEACAHISTTERRSDDCEYAVNDMKIAEYMENHIGEEYEGVITTLLRKGFFVETDKYIEGFVSLDLLKGFYELSDDSLFYYNRRNQKCFNLGSKVKVRCIAASKEARTVDFTIIGE